MVSVSLGRRQGRRQGKTLCAVGTKAAVLLLVAGVLALLWFLVNSGVAQDVGTETLMAAVGIPKAKEAGSEELLLNATKGTHHCLNSDFQPKEKRGVWTMINDNTNYVRSALKLGKSIKRHTQTPIDLVVMELDHKPLGGDIWESLHRVGYQRCVVKPIPPPKVEATRKDLREKFGVLHVWAMTVYETVLFLDADTFVQNSLDELIHMDLQGKPIGVTKDIRERKWVNTFNSGVLLLHPSVEEYNRLIQLLQSGMEFEYIMSDQGFLNAVYGSNWHEIGFLNNANIALYKFQRKFWDEHKFTDINILHFTMEKPWKCNPRSFYYHPICKVWMEAD